ncbi:hypothetical protein EZV62_003757 [Acer yangbiense]|uniref:TauD/TfdA-like domain-containing protein n=1 Tax=Acer yangbiense TaxID=1000413 RepID=A0A5C7IJI8_9ROSI|nr:hypothetical protein EZV62_003757 [Acer yangbiense]
MDLHLLHCDQRRRSQRSHRIVEDRIRRFLKTRCHAKLLIKEEDEDKQRNECLKILEEECVAIPWQGGDVLLIDNWAELHTRRPTNSPRRVLASFCK